MPGQGLEGLHRLMANRFRFTISERAAANLEEAPVLQGDDALDVVGGGQRLHPHIIIYQHSAPPPIWKKHGRRATTSLSF